MGESFRRFCKDCSKEMPPASSFCPSCSSLDFQDFSAEELERVEAQREKAKRAAKKRKEEEQRQREEDATRSIREASEKLWSSLAGFPILSLSSHPTRSVARVCGTVMSVSSDANLLNPFTAAKPPKEVHLGGLGEVVDELIGQAKRLEANAIIGFTVQSNTHSNLATPLGNFPSSETIIGYGTAVVLEGE